MKVLNTINLNLIVELIILLLVEFYQEKINIG